MRLTPEQIRQELDRRTGRNKGGAGTLALPMWWRALSWTVLRRATIGDLETRLDEMGVRRDPPWWSRSDAYRVQP